MHKIFKIQYEKLLEKFFKGTNLTLKGGIKDINDISTKVIIMNNNNNKNIL